MSRISLAIRVASIKKANVPVMIFDEVDVGIGGGVAEVVGKLLKDFNDIIENPFDLWLTSSDMEVI